MQVMMGNFCDSPGGSVDYPGEDVGVLLLVAVVVVVLDLLEHVVLHDLRSDL